MVELLRGRTGHYIFASSTVIYAHSRLLPITEDHPVDRSERQNEYGRHKLLCEDILVRAHREHGFPATTMALSMVFGPHNIVPDREQRMFVRLLQGRKILIPGDGTALGQVGHVDDQARALRLAMGRPVTFGRRYNLTGRDYFSDEGYVDAIAEVLGAEPRKVSIPAPLMNDLWDGRIELAWGEQVQSNIDIRSSEQERAAFRAVMRQHRLAHLIQKLAPHLHRWNESTLFDIDRLRRDIGWEPEYCFRGMVEQTWDWFRSEGLDRTARFDFGYEDELLARLGE
jgi:nucleoside-diphosphate-sugar epimerase